MSKRIYLSILLIAALFMAGCNKENSSVGETEVSLTVSAVSSIQPIENEKEEMEIAEEVSEYELVTNEVAAGEYAYAENLNTHGLVAISVESGSFISWRSLANENGAEYVLTRNGKEVYRGKKTCFSDAEGKGGVRYSLSVAGSDKEETTVCSDKEYIEISLNHPQMQWLPMKRHTEFTANDCSVADLDGDGELELIVKWYPDNAQDNSADGYTGCTYLDAYDIDYNNMTASFMWRIDLGINIRSGAHYTQFQVWDYDGDGKAELICKTADGTTTYDSNMQETGHVGAVSMTELDASLSPSKQEYDYRQYTGRVGRIVLGTEYLTAFRGDNGTIIDSVEYVPSRGPFLSEKGIYDTSLWGIKDGMPAEKNDGYANRADRFLAGTAYVDEGTACAIFARGYYGRTAVTAWKLADNKLCLKWYFDADSYSKYAGQGNHQLSINDVDNDGFDEIIYGSLCLDHTGEVLYSTGLGHGDAMHISDWNNDGRLEVFAVHEETTATYSVELHDAETGKIIFGEGLNKDVGRGLAADIDPDNPGAEMWSASRNGTYDSLGNKLYDNKPSVNFALYWDDDLLMELFDSNSSEELIPVIQKWDYKERKLTEILRAEGCLTNNGTKANACLLGDILGDWREEIIVRDAEDPSKLRIYTSFYDTDYVFECLLLNRTYREGIAWQNTAYNQPANLPYLLSEKYNRNKDE